MQNSINTHSCCINILIDFCVHLVYTINMKKMLVMGIVFCLLAASVGCKCLAVSTSPTTEPTAEPTLHIPTTPTPSPSPQAVVIMASSSPTSTPISTPQPTPSPEPLLLDGLIIGIDAGHQKHSNSDCEQICPDSPQIKSKVSSGTRGIQTRIYEYEVNLDVALILRDLLEASGAIVVMVRTDNDVNISNQERAQLFNNANVDLAVRLHCNGSDDHSNRGAFMLIPDEAHTDWYNENLEAATCIIGSYCELTGLTMRGASNGITERDDQTGFNWCNRPIVNIEMGHMTNADEDILLTDPDFQQLMARGIYDGIAEYFTKGQK